MPLALLLLASCALAEPVAPPLPEPRPEDLLQFPCDWVVTANIRAGEKHLAWVRAMRRLHPHDPDLLDWEWECEELLAVWELLESAQRLTSGSDEGPQEKLWELRDKLGSDYDRGLMPPVVPHWRFRRLP